MGCKRRFFDEDFFDDLFDSINSIPFEYRHAFRPIWADIIDAGNTYVYEIELPGCAKQDIKVDLKEGYLIVTREKPEKDLRDEKNYVRRERMQYQCSRKFYVGKQVTKADIKARYEEGVLYITIPKKDNTKKEDDDSIIID